jgi:RNA polymerase sigma-70 factor (ECF subfamily)
MPDDPQTQFMTFLDRHQGIVSKVARMYCWHREERRDLEQEIVAQLWRSFPNFDQRASFSTWAYRIALNVSISYVRSATVRNRHSGVETTEASLLADDGDQVERDDRLRALYVFASKLDGLNRALLLLYLEDRNQRDIAEVLGISESNVSTKINRLKQRLREEYST